jgi:hypothetical protein
MSDLPDRVRRILPANTKWWSARQVRALRSAGRFG